MWLLAELHVGAANRRGRVSHGVCCKGCNKFNNEVVNCEIASAQEEIAADLKEVKIAKGGGKVYTYLVL